VAYSGFSPNGDGINDKFVIEGIQKYPENRVLIFNRWGNLVYATRTQTESWNGFVAGKLAPAGRYSYKVSYRTLINEELVEDVFRGTVRIIR
jgi:gliding motility-associated-like protein